MKNHSLIATVGSLTVAAAANAAFQVTTSQATWSTAMTIATYVDAGSISNTSQASPSSPWTGGDGWENFSLTGGGGGVGGGAITTTGSAPAVTALNFSASSSSPYTYFEFDFVGSEAVWGPTGTNGLYGVLFNISFSPDTTMQGVTVTINGTQTLVISGVGTNSGYVGVYQDTSGAGRIDKIQFQLSSGQSAIMTGYTVAAIPAPGALALVGVAGLVGSRRRR